MIHPAKVVIRIDTNIERRDTVSVSVYSDFEDNGSLLIRFYRSRPEYAAYAGISYLLASGRGNEVAGFELSVERTPPSIGTDRPNTMRSLARISRSRKGSSLLRISMAAPLKSCSSVKPGAWSSTRRMF